MAISGSIEISGLVIPNSYTNIKTFTYINTPDGYNINCEYNIFVDESHRDLNPTPLQTNRINFTIASSGSLDVFEHIYTKIKQENYFISSSLTDC